ncbi:MAG: hypothetical protein MR902_01495, partial [Campylobacter sp.]|nr:hypothetical protein [Campylobacter sp.]
DTNKESISFKYDGVFNKDLVINYKTNSSNEVKTITIQNQSNIYSAIETIQLDDNSFISSNQINKIIQDLNSYGDDKGLNLNFNSEFKNNDIMQIYNG